MKQESRENLIQTINCNCKRIIELSEVLINGRSYERETAIPEYRNKMKEIRRDSIRLEKEFPNSWNWPERFTPIKDILKEEE